MTFDLGVGGQSARTNIPTSTACRVTVAGTGARALHDRAQGRVPVRRRPPLPAAASPVRIESDGPPIVVERSTYWSAGGQFWAAGASTLLTPLP